VKGAEQTNAGDAAASPAFVCSAPFTNGAVMDT
jgi:hypothetical protein